MKMENTTMNIDFNVRIIEIAGIKSALEALRLPFGKECRSDLEFDYNFDESANIFSSQSKCSIDAKDITLLSTLVKRGDEHAKAIRGINVYLSIDAPRFWWQEMDTYRIGSERLGSESTMHIQGKGLSQEDLVRMKSELPEGTMQKRIQCFSYQTLRRIYHQRAKHRLPHWHIFCDFIKALPYAKELITGEYNNQEQ